MAQTPPRSDEVQGYRGLLAAVAGGNRAEAERLIAAGADLDVRDPFARTPLMLAAYSQDHDMARRLIAAGCDVDALEGDRYDALTIAAVENDHVMVDILIAAGANAGLTTSPYDGTALIASAHLGHVAVVRALIAAKAPMDHVNNLGWTALIEAIVLGDGGKNHTAIVNDLIEAGADVDLADRDGRKPLRLARRHGFDNIAAALEAAGAIE